MTVLFDTSVLVAAVLRQHPAHPEAAAWLQAVKSEERSGVVAAHSIVELYSVLTRLPLQPRIDPDTARRIIRHDVVGSFGILALAADDHSALIDQLADNSIAGGATYDALILATARKAGVHQVLTLNTHDYERLAPMFDIQVVSPTQRPDQTPPAPGVG